MYNYWLLFVSVLSLSWRCDSPEFGDISYTHFLYKEDNVNEVKWLEKNEYCRAKGDTSVYFDAGQGKCEYSRGLCYWDNGCFNTGRDNDPVGECQDLYYGNILVEGLDNGRLVLQQTEEVQEEPVQEEQSQEVQEEPVQEEPVQEEPVQEEQSEEVQEEPVQEEPVQEEQSEEVQEEQTEVFGQCPVSIREPEQEEPAFDILVSGSIISTPSLLLFLIFL
jgi:hypothetical protein